MFCFAKAFLPISATYGHSWNKGLLFLFYDFWQVMLAGMLFCRQLKLEELVYLPIL